MKIDVKNVSFFQEENKIKLSKKIKKGLATGFLLAGMSIMLTGCGEDKVSDNPAMEYTVVDDLVIEPIEVELDEINELNVIINDNDCSDTFINDVCAALDEDGLKYQFTRAGENIDIDDSVVITLDQQYISGPGMVILAPYENERAGNSDVLAMAADTAFEQKGFFTDGIFCGKTGYRETEFGTTTTRVATSTEEKIGMDKNTSFTTICFGTSNINSGLVAESIENTLGRYVSYMKDVKDDTNDLIHRVGAADTISGLAEQYHTSSSNLNKVNGMDYDNVSIQLDQAMINPAIENFSAFDKTIPVQLNSEKTTVKTN